MIIDIGPKFYSALSPPLLIYDLEVMVTDLEIYVEVLLKVFKIS